MAVMATGRGAGPFTVVIPTVGRPSLGWLVAALAAGTGPAPAEVVVVDDRPVHEVPLPLPAVDLAVVVVDGAARGPAAARNRGWRRATTPWVAFLDDDVLPPPGWAAALEVDLATVSDDVAATQGRIRVPLPQGRRPTDWERNVNALESACWATADMAYRRSALEEVGGFDERFERAFREDSDLGLRVIAAGYHIARGRRWVEHPVGPAGPWVSLERQRGNADDILMGALHGAGWRRRAHAGPSRDASHAGTVLAALTAVAAGLTGHRRLGAAGALTWAALAGNFCATRIAPGPSQAAEVATMVTTSLAIPFAATWHQVRGAAALPRLLADERRAPLGCPRSPLALSPPAPWRRLRRWPVLGGDGWRPAAVLFDRDGTLVVDRPYARHPDPLVAMPGAPVALRRLRAAGLPLGVVTNQSGVARGLLSMSDVEAVNARVEQLVGPFGTWQVCPHGPGEGCGCRKPAPGLIKAAAAALGVDVSRCVVVGDIGSDVEAAHAAGARPILIPTRATRPAETAAAPTVVPDLLTAADLILASR
jgi:histidinol-phosphate phosphatase family protein